MNGTASLPGDVAPVNFPAVTLPTASGRYEYTEGQRMHRRSAPVHPLPFLVYL